VRIAISHLEWDVPIRDSAFVATYTQPVALPPMECWGNLRCNLDIPEELEGRVLPNRQTVGRIVDVERGFFGLDTNGAQVLCHFPPGFQDHAHSLAVRPGNVKDHLAHGDQLHACPGQPDARPDPEDPPGVLTICHIPPGNNQAGRQLQLPPAAIPGHLNHGDHLGPCRPRAATAPPGGRPRAATEPNPAGPLPDPAGGEPPADAATGCFGCRTAQGPGWGAWGALAILLARRRR
jgi:hypothetical protein